MSFCLLIAKPSGLRSYYTALNRRRSFGDHAIPCNTFDEQC